MIRSLTFFFAKALITLALSFVSGLIVNSEALAKSKEYTPVEFSDFKENVDMNNAVPWVAPNYSGQEKALGYEVGAFSTPAGMEERVSFWLSIYTKYTTDEGVLHDSLYPHIIYEPVDFRPIMKRTDIDIKAKRKLRRKLVDDKKEQIRQRLMRLKSLKNSIGLEGEDLRYWYLFAKVTDSNKFVDASQKGRLRFQLGQRDRFIKGIFYSGRYLKAMEEIFRSQGLPIELTRLPFVESSFNVGARSRVGASGIWQWMRFAAKPYLKMNAAVDERNDPLKATWASARQLRSNFNMLGNWPLAVTAYNHGPSGVRRMTKKYSTNSIVDLIEKRYRRFGFASSSFFASFLAAVEAEKNAAKYYGKVFHEKPIQSAEVNLNKRIDRKLLLKWFAGDVERAKKYNPHIKKAFWKSWVHLPRRSFVRVPPDQYKVATADLKALKRPAKLEGPAQYRVTSGETMGGIAQRFGVSLSRLLEINGISNPRSVRAGRRILIPPAKVR